MGLRVINLAEAIKTPGMLTKRSHKKTVGLVWNVLEKEKKPHYFARKTLGQRSNSENIIFTDAR